MVAKVPASRAAEATVTNQCGVFYLVCRKYKMEAFAPMITKNEGRGS
jgi:hypothetical protein